MPAVCKISIAMVSERKKKGIAGQLLEANDRFSTKSLHCKCVFATTSHVGEMGYDC
jgi:hypothetical protein